LLRPAEKRGSDTCSVSRSCLRPSR
jgi:hypothetical protein